MRFTTSSMSGTALVQVVLFLFGLVNAGVSLSGYDTGTSAVLARGARRPAARDPRCRWGWRVLAGLHLPRHLGWREFVVVALATSADSRSRCSSRPRIVAIGPVLDQLTIGALATGVGALLALGAARLLHIGRFAVDRRERKASMTFRLKSRLALSSESVEIVLRQLEAASAELTSVGDPESDEAIHDARRRVKKVRAVIRLIGRA